MKRVWVVSAHRPQSWPLYAASTKERALDYIRDQHYGEWCLDEWTLDVRYGVPVTGRTVYVHRAGDLVALAAS